ncbi:ROK family protein [Agromyces atrinae]|uniref:ROK family transcriptional regulator n=1 Tax=Agromyces atrinae TaxID=592376 RepID=UPI001F580109|nr:ROK family protein [Agromyces atrinae]MCI2956915.1 ROK family protein [Agromyces atrinae]
MLPTLRLQVPALSARISPSVTASTLARLIASGAAPSQADLVRVTGLSRSTVAAGVRLLADLHAIRGVGLREAVGRGRRAELLELDPQFGVTVILDFGARSVRVAVADLGQQVLGSSELPIHVADGPAQALDAALEEARRLIDLADVDEHYRVTVVGVPGPVDARAGMAVRPPIMPGWDGFDIGGHVQRELGGDVIVANDVNLRVLGEARAHDTDAPLLYVKVGTGIGGGIATEHGELLKGADGAAGDIGHLRTFGSDAACSCGRSGCLEATASVAALARERFGETPDAVAVFLQHVREGDAGCRTQVQQAAETIGEVVAELVHFYNPGRVLLGGELAEISDDLLAGVRSVVYRRALPLATRSLAIEVATLGARAGIAGGVVLGTEAALNPERIGRLGSRLADRQRRASLIRSSAA